MNDNNIFIVGANGQLGTALRRQYPNSKYADVDELDITDRQSVENFDWSGINIVINAAAFTNVDGAETCNTGGCSLNATAGSRRSLCGLRNL